ncbi:hypothetical protein BDV24DRAFT_147016 [Aspergillus arachidicola]|uniref:Uncharacterized protein n=1 Tax=Aspergillus arachidicola TaxID=656916 RepID=A0A5N6YQ45_9EURO|nr:hypothetical protein BDV24DRAFT_147016 [Aspergillus arachidicola]
MQPFRFKFSNDGVVAGAHFVPPLSASCYFDGIPRYSASFANKAFGVPFVSIDRPSYGGTKTGVWLHRYILPTLWSEIGAPTNATPLFICPTAWDTDHVLFPLDKRDVIMFKLETTVPEVLELCDRLNAVSPLPKIVQFPAVWLPAWKETQMSVPVMFTLDELEICVQAFKRSVRVVSHWSQGWYAGCFGLAMECCASLVSSN